MSDFFGDVDLFGLDEFGEGFGATYGGILIGAGATLLAPSLLRKVPVGFVQQHADHLGLAAAAATVAALWKNKRMIAVQTALTAGTIWLLPRIARYIDGVGLGAATVNYLNGLGLPQVDYLNGLGIATVSPEPVSYGTIPGVYGAVAGPHLSATGQPPVDLLGQSTAASEQVALLGGPSVSGLASMYGATLFGN